MNMCKALVLNIFFSLILNVNQLPFTTIYTYWVNEQTQNQQIEEDIAYRRDMNSIDEMNTRNEYANLIAYSYQVENKWGSINIERYTELMLKLASAIHNSAQPIEIRYTDAQNIALRALEKFDKHSLETIVRLLPYLQDRPITVDDETVWAKKRKTNIELWLRAWQKLEQNIDKKFNFDDLPSINVLPPLETGLPAGVSPLAIKDLRLRMEYEESILKNTRKVEYYNHQYRLQTIIKWFPRKAKEFIIGAYSQPPSNIDELNQLLFSHLIDGKNKDDILQQISDKRR